MDAQLEESSARVRDHFCGILTEHYDIREEHAIELVSNWKYGKSSEVLYYDLETYQKIFGDEIGAILFTYQGDYRVAIGRPRPFEKTKFQIFMKWFLLIVGPIYAIWLVGLLAALIFFPRERPLTYIYDLIKRRTSQYEVMI